MSQAVPRRVVMNGQGTQGIWGSWFMMPAVLAIDAAKLLANDLRILGLFRECEQAACRAEREGAVAPLMVVSSDAAVFWLI